MLPKHGRKKIGIFVIAYNAESTIKKTLSRIPNNVWSAITVVYVVDDCSTDGTIDKALSFKKLHHKLVVLRNHVNKMYGGNQKIGYQYAIDTDLDVVVMLHADGQYAPEYLHKLISFVSQGKADIVLGSRMLKKGSALKGGMPLYKYYGNIILTKIQNILTGMHLSEFHSGYRAYSVNLLRRIPFWENTNDWHFDTEILLQAHESKCKIREVSIPTYYGNEICRVNGLQYAMHCVLTSFKYYLFRKHIVYSRSFDVAEQKYKSKFDDPFSSHSKILSKLKKVGIHGKKILEIGVGDASLTKKMFDDGAIVDGIDNNSISVELARPFCRNIYSLDLETIDSIKINNMYDIVIMADVLEHLKNAELILSKAKKYLNKGGMLIVSLPNVANIYVRINVLFGRFPYHSKGILDNTHVHFYTLKSAQQLLTQTGWVITDRDITSMPLSIIFPFLSRNPYRLILNLVHLSTKLWKGLFAYQSIWYCINPNNSTLL